MGHSFDEQARKDARRRAVRDNPKSESDWATAAEKGEQRRMEQLLAAGQDINGLDDWQKAPALYIAARTNNLELAEWLLERGADPCVATDDHWTPAYIAISKGLSSMLQLLVRDKYGFGARAPSSLREITLEKHLELAVQRMDWRCVYSLEAILGVGEGSSSIPPSSYKLPDGWAMGHVPKQVPKGGFASHDEFLASIKPFYWKAFTKEACQDEPPEGSVKLIHKVRAARCMQPPPRNAHPPPLFAAQGKGVFEPESTQA